MNQKINIHRLYKKNITIYSILFLGTFLFLQIAYRYHFFYVEQFQLFLTTPSYLIECLSQPGGMIEYVAHFFVQFFIVPFVGAFITAFFLTLSYVLSDQLLARITRKKNIFIGPVSIFLIQLYLSFDAYFLFQGILAYLLCLSTLQLLELCRRPGAKFLFAFLLTLIIYWIAGPVSILFAFCFALMSLREENKRKLLGLPVFGLALLISYLSVRYSLTGNYLQSFLPDMYYYSSVKPVSLVYLSWIILPFWIIVYPYHNTIKKFKLGKKEYFMPLLQTIIIAGLLFVCTWKFTNIQHYKLKKLDYFARNEQWDEIIDYCEEKTIDNLVVICYQNLALAQKGVLADKLFYLSQRGVEGLEIEQKDIGGLAPLLSDIRFFLGDIASSQRYAFEGNIFTHEGSGRLMKRLVQTNLIYGEYPVAEKYIHYLENTFFYRKWANQQRRFLFNDSLCIADHLIRGKRKFLPPESRKVVIKDILEESGVLFGQNPQNKAAEQYMFAGYLLAKDIRGFKNMFSKYKIGKMAAELPDAYQQALLVYYEDQPGQWAKAGISEINIRQFKQYKITLNNNQKHPHLEKMMKKYFGSTYWFFLHFR
ncbi:MAG: DUF6057 family protein [Thermodesulfobacteriota bacterium]